MLSRNKKDEYIFRQIYYATLKRYYVRYKLTVSLFKLRKCLLFQLINCNKSHNKSTIKNN